MPTPFQEFINIACATFCLIALSNTVFAYQSVGNTCTGEEVFSLLKKIEPNIVDLAVHKTPEATYYSAHASKCCKTYYFNEDLSYHCVSNYSGLGSPVTDCPNTKDKEQTGFLDFINKRALSMSRIWSAHECAKPE